MSSSDCPPGSIRKVKTPAPLHLHLQAHSAHLRWGWQRANTCRAEDFLFLLLRRDAASLTCQQQHWKASYGARIWISVIVLAAEASSQHNGRYPGLAGTTATAQMTTKRPGMCQGMVPTMTVLDGQVLRRNACRGITAPSDHEAAAQHNHHLCLARNGQINYVQLQARAINVSLVTNFSLCSLA